MKRWVGAPAGVTLGVALPLRGAAAFGAPRSPGDLDFFAELAERFRMEQELAAVFCDPVLVARGK